MVLDLGDSCKCIIAGLNRPLHWKVRFQNLFSNREPWVKKSVDEEFDVPMGCHNGAEVWDLVEVYILNLLTTVTRK